MPPLIVCDLDGTLLDGEHRLGDFTRSVLLDLLGRGIEIILASGRHVQDMLGIRQLLDGAGGWLISSNGAAVHAPDGRLLASSPIPIEALEFLLHDPLFRPVHRNLYRPDDWLVDRPNPDLLRYHRVSGFRYRLVDFSALDDQAILKVFYQHPDAGLLQRLEKAIRETFGDRLSLTYSLPWVLEVMAPGVSKGAALARLLEHLDHPPEEVIAFGDGRNDLEMLDAVGEGILMGNAAAALKQALPHLPVIGSHRDEAVARYLAERFLSS